MKKLIIDYEPFYEMYSDIELGSVFYFNTLEEIFNFIRIASENSYHSYYIEDFNEDKEEEKNA